MSQVVVRRDQASQQERQRTPEDSRDGFHAEIERVLGEVSWIWESIFFPELAQDGLFAG